MTNQALQELSCSVKLSNEGICRRAKLDVGTLCNYECKFCYYASKLNEVTHFQTIKNRIDRLYNLGCRDFDLSGGEPTILPFWFDLLQYLKEKRVKFSTLTNGSKFHDIEFLKKSQEYGLNEVLFSLHGLKEFHNSIVQNSFAFDRIIKAIHNAKSLGILTRINTVITTQNFYSIDKGFKDLILQLNPHEINFLPLNYFEDSKNLKLEPLNYEIILKPIKNFIQQCQSKFKINVRYVPFCHMLEFEKFVKGYFQHIYEKSDWNLAWYEYAPNTLENLKKQATENRIRNYNKSHDCLKCKFFYVCDGIEPQNPQVFKPVPGEKITQLP